MRVNSVQLKKIQKIGSRVHIIYNIIHTCIQKKTDIFVTLVSEQCCVVVYSQEVPSP
jgi:hypothetical protein